MEVRGFGAGSLFFNLWFEVLGMQKWGGGSRENQSPSLGTKPRKVEEVSRFRAPNPGNTCRASRRNPL